MILALHPGIDADAHAAAFRTNGHTRVQPFLDHAVAAALHAELRERTDWLQVVNSGDKVFELDRKTRAAMSPAQLATLDTAVHNGARTGFQHRYEALRLVDGDALSTDNALFAQLPAWLSAGAPRDLLRRITGAADIAFADGQATAYAPGDFLTGHDDAVPGKGRRAAYVLGLTPTWRIEWGGLLLFHHSNTVRGVSPGFNSIDLFAVPQMHSVSQVTPAAAYRRYAVTGWLRGPRPA